MLAFPAAANLQRWDALPALDVKQWQGPYSGQTVCPMCRHGYDAGVLVLIPADAPANRVRAGLEQLRDASAEIDDPRFRLFIVFLSQAPSSLELISQDLPPHWYVGTLLEHERDTLQGEFGPQAMTRGIGHVFAQRRSLRAFDPLQASEWSDLAADLSWARDLLAYAYAEPVKSADPDTPKGLLWTAPKRPNNRVLLQEGSTPRQLCVVGQQGDRFDDMLVRLAPIGQNSSAHWGRTDDGACLQLSGSDVPLRAELFPWRARPLALSVAASRADPQSMDVPRVAASQQPRATAVSGNERVVGTPCQNCSAVFIGLPQRVPTITRLAAVDEPGQPLQIRGRVIDAQGRARPGVVVCAYQTDASGHYPPDNSLPSPAKQQGRLRGWALSDENGRYGFDTIRPASYPKSSVEQHVHMHVVEPGRCTYYLGDLLFDDDPKLSPRQRERAARAHGGNGIASPEGDADGWRVQRDIQLDLNVAGYQQCQQDSTALVGAQ